MRLGHHTHARPDERPDPSPPAPPLSRAVAAGVVAVLGLSLLATGAHAQPDEAAAQQAAREIAAAQQRADDAAGRWSEAEALLTTLEDEVVQLQQEQAALQDQVDALRDTVSKAAAERFMGAGSGGIPILTGYQQPLDQLSAAELGRVASGASDNTFDQYAVAERDLAAKSDALAAKQAEVTAQRETYEQLAAEAQRQVEHLQQVEKQRLADEQVRLALEAQRREEQRRLAEQQAAEAARRQAEEAQRAAEQQAARDAQAQEEAARAAANQAAAPAASDVAQAPAAVGSGASGAAGADGGAAQEPDPAPQAPADPGMICPVQGPSAYSDTWGAARRGGRRHEGVDMIAPHGTPLVAVADGDARFWTNGQGALGVSLTADNGTRYYYGHLSSYAGSSGRRRDGPVARLRRQDGSDDGEPPALRDPPRRWRARQPVLLRAQRRLLTPSV